MMFLLPGQDDVTDTFHHVTSLG